MRGETKRTVKLYCPSLSKVVQLVAGEEQRLDLGSIARAFGLEPASLKLNGHFISRGVDLIASSVTWKSLLSFFSARGLATGATDSDALIVDGKLSKLGSKRTHEPADVENVSFGTKDRDHSCVNTRLQSASSKLLNTKRLKDSSSGLINRITSCSSLNLKRRLLSEDLSSLKRTRVQKTELVLCRSSDDRPSTTPGSQFPCSFISQNMKRMREEEMLVASPCKRIR